jgi:hypothetical protein
VKPVYFVLWDDVSWAMTHSRTAAQRKAREVQSTVRVCKGANREAASFLMTHGGLSRTMMEVLSTDTEAQ